MDATARIINKGTAAVQITAEQILREVQEHQEPASRAPAQRVEDIEELSDYRGRKRNEFEERVQRTRGNIKEWVRYANWEASQGEFPRARSVFERALDVDPQSVQVWLSYTDMELKARNVLHARNLFDRAVTLLPRIDQLWYKYTYLEELLHNIPGTRQVFERWMQWEPEDKAWQAYIKMEERYNELDRVGAIYERWIAVRPHARVWVKWAQFEEDRGLVDKAREVFEAALGFYGEDGDQIEKAQIVFDAFAKMETRRKEYDRARVIYEFALSRIPRSESGPLQVAYTKFEKQHETGPRAETAVLQKRRLHYEDVLSRDGSNYDAWFDYARLEENAYIDLKDEGATKAELSSAASRVREVYEHAIAQVPPRGEKRFWRRYIFLWLYYAIFEEFQMKDYDRTREVYKTVLELVPQKQFTFAKLWVLFAKFEVRRLQLHAARKILGAGIGLAPKGALFKGYIQLELELREFDNVRKIYEKYLQHDPSSTSAWVNFAELETQLGDYPRARGIFELGIKQSVSIPEVLWKVYIDFEIQQGQRQNARNLYERLTALCERSVNVWTAYALFEAEDMQITKQEGEYAEEEEEEDNDVEIDHGDCALSQAIFQRGYDHMKTTEERREFLIAWTAFEHTHGSSEDLPRVARIGIVSKNVGHELNDSNLKFLQSAQAWKNKRDGT